MNNANYIVPYEKYNIDESLFLDNLPNLEDFSFTSQISKNIKNLKKIIGNDESYKEKLENIEEIIDRDKNSNHRYFNVSNALLKSEAFYFLILSHYLLE